MRKVTSAGGLVFDNGRMLVIKHPDGFYGFVKGHVEPNEAVEEAALREVREEAGLQAKIVRYFATINRNATEDSGEVVDKDIVLFLMRATGKPDTEPEEETDWITIEQALSGKWYDAEISFLKEYESALVDIAAGKDQIAEDDKDDAGSQ